MRMSEAGWPAIVAHRERLLRIARRRCPTLQDAEDVVHEAMVRCATFADLDDDRLGQFLTSVTMRLCADVYRHADRSLRVFGRVATDDLEPGPEDAACQAADAAVLAELLSTLPDRQRAVLVDRARGLSMQQICSRRGLTYKAAESALARARGTMRTALASGFAVVTATAVALRALRPRRVAIAALPVASLVLAGTVLRLPLTDPAPRLTILRPGTAQGETTEAANVMASGRSLVRPAPGNAVTATSGTRGTRGTRAKGAAARQPREILSVGDPSLVQLRSTDDDPDRQPEDEVHRCLHHGVWVEVGDPTQASPAQGCGHKHSRDAVKAPGTDVVTVEGAVP
jgi:RNA polymerase sigma factor (sigma-70 family)